MQPVDVALVGTGIAPLIAAQRLLSQEKSVALINPDWDFFREDSELPFDPFWPIQRENMIPDALLNSSLDRTLEILRPAYPGALEVWDPNVIRNSKQVYLADAPHVRSRSRLWIRSNLPSADLKHEKNWEILEDMYVEASDAGLNPRVVEDLTAAKQFPGFSGIDAPHLRGIFLPRMADIDVVRYRNGVLELIQQKLGEARIYKHASQLQMTPTGVRIHSAGDFHSIPIKENLYFYWTPRMTSLLNRSFRETFSKAKITLPEPKGIQIWEQWNLVSRDWVTPDTIGNFESMVIWSNFEGAPPSTVEPSASQLAVLRPGAFVAGTELKPLEIGKTWASQESFRDLTRLCEKLLKWNHFTIRSMRPRAIFTWEPEVKPVTVPSQYQTTIIPRCDGPLVQILKMVKTIMETPE